MPVAALSAFAVALLAEGVDRNPRSGWREAISLPAVWQGVGEGPPPAALGDPRARKRRFTHAEFFKGLDMQQ